MWQTQHGERTLKGAEAAIFAEALFSLLNEAITGELDYYDLGVECFDNLTFGQKISVLSTVGKGLLCKDIPLVRINAVLEGTIAAVFEHLKNEITFEIDTLESWSHWRCLVIAARNEIGAKNIPEVYCTDLDKWEAEVEELADAILRNKDFGEAHLYIDFPPEKSKQLKDRAGIPDDYFLAIADDLKDEQAQEKIIELKKLCESIVKKNVKGC